MSESESEQYNPVTFKKQLEKIFEEGGSPAVQIIAGLGVIYWPSLTSEEKEFVRGWLACQRYMKGRDERNNPNRS